MDIVNNINYKDIIDLFEELKLHNIYGYISGGQAYKYYYNDLNDNTTDYDIELYINSKQLNNLETFNNIYNCIQNLYNKCKLYINNLNKLPKFDYNKNYKKIYVPYKLIQNRTSYYNYNIICDIQIDSKLDTLIDLVIIYTPELDNIKQKISSTYYIKKEYFYNIIIKYYNDLSKYKKKYNNKINKIKARINFINNNNNNSNNSVYLKNY